MPKWLDLPPLWLIAIMVLMYLDAVYVALMPEWPMPWLGGDQLSRTEDNDRAASDAICADHQQRFRLFAEPNLPD